MLHASQATDATGVLLIAYWALNLPDLGQELAMLVHQYPGQRSVLLRALEPLGAPELESAAESANSLALTDLRGADSEPSPVAAAIRFEGVAVRAAGHTILESVTLDIAPGSHVAIVGGSGAGKSSLVGLLLGWHRPVVGRVLVDGHVGDSTHLDALRTQTVWVDPAVQLWNRSLLDNLLYGNRETGLERVGDVVQQAELYDVLQRLPDGLQTVLGEAGGLVSGGEGQRVKFGRGLARVGPRLVILDEPFRGLERGRRHALLEQARRHWRDATLLCVTHDVRETLSFPRVLVLEDGQVVEDGRPDELVADSGSRYRRLLDAEDAVRGGLWGSRIWRRLQLRAGGLAEQSPTQGASP